MPTTTDTKTLYQEPSAAPAPVRPAQDEPVPHTGAAPDRGSVDLSLLRAGLDELSSLSKPREFPEFFARYAQETGVRMLLLKRWTSGLQVFMEANIHTPAEARDKRPDGRAPIPCESGDVFQAAGADAEVYAGAIPLDHFPPDLIFMLGRGSRDRKIVILPLPSQNHWNTFIYLDGGEAGGRALDAAEILARFALVRMINLTYRQSLNGGRVEAIRKAEEERRQQAATPAEAVTPTILTEAGPAAEPVSLSEYLSDAATTESPSPAPGTSAFPEADPFVSDGAGDADDTPPAGVSQMTPEALIRRSGELPALPKAACHIMAVIEDPRTTATGLEKALAMDQALTAKVLRIANSPFYGAVREIHTVSEAIVRLGFVAIRNWTLVTAARSIFLAPGAGMLYQRIWKQSVLSAMAAQLVAQTVGGREPEAVFVGGLMQNIGQLVLARTHPELFRDILEESAATGRPYHEVERETLGFDHGELGSQLIREWNLSSDTEDAVRWHHRFDDDGARNARMAAMIALGEEIALCSSAPAALTREEGRDSMPATLRAGAAARYLDLSGDGVEKLLKAAADLHIDPHFFS